MKTWYLGLLVGAGVFATDLGVSAALPEVWSEQLGMQQLTRNRFRISDVNKRQNDSAKIAKFFGVVALEGTPGNFDDCRLKARWNRRKMRVKVYEEGGDVNITAKAKRGAYVFQLEEADDLTAYGAGTAFFFRVKRGRRKFRRSPIHIISSRVSGGGAGRHRVTIIGS